MIIMIYPWCFYKTGLFIVQEHGFQPPRREMTETPPFGPWSLLHCLIQLWRWRCTLTVIYGTMWVQFCLCLHYKNAANRGYTQHTFHLIIIVQFWSWSFLVPCSLVASPQLIKLTSRMNQFGQLGSVHNKKLGQKNKGIFKIIKLKLTWTTPCAVLTRGTIRGRCQYKKIFPQHFYRQSIAKKGIAYINQQHVFTE